MYTSQYFKHKFVALWVFIGLSLTFGYEVQAHIPSLPDVELVEVHNTIKQPRIVSYTQAIHALYASEYLALHTAFSFKHFLQKQKQMLQCNYVTQGVNYKNTKSSLVSLWIPLHFPLSDDTDTDYLLT